MSFLLGGGLWGAVDFTSTPYSYGFSVIILFSTSVHTVLDAQWLTYQVQMYYASRGDRRKEILKTFNSFSEKFDHMTRVKELKSEIESRVLTESVRKRRDIVHLRN